MTEDTGTIITLQACDADCAFYRHNKGAPASRHIHFPTYVLEAQTADGKCTLRVPTRYVGQDGKLARDILAREHPWFGVGRPRGELAKEAVL